MIQDDLQIGPNLVLKVLMQNITLLTLFPNNSLFILILSILHAENAKDTCVASSYRLLLLVFRLDVIKINGENESLVNILVSVHLIK